MEKDPCREIIEELVRFRDERDWTRFHNAKDLALALSIEAAELNELFLWQNGTQIEKVDPRRIREELADILTYAFLLAEKYGFDVPSIIREKIRVNAGKYPVEKARGTAKKYDKLQ